MGKFTGTPDQFYGKKRPWFSVKIFPWANLLWFLIRYLWVIFGSWKKGWLSLALDESFGKSERWALGPFGPSDRCIIEAGPSSTHPTYIYTHVITRITCNSFYTYLYILLVLSDVFVLCNIDTPNGFKRRNGAIWVGKRRLACLMRAGLLCHQREYILLQLFFFFFFVFYTHIIYDIRI